MCVCVGNVIVYSSCITKGSTSLYPVDLCTINYVLDPVELAVRMNDSACVFVCLCM